MNNSGKNVKLSGVYEVLSENMSADSMVIR